MYKSFTLTEGDDAKFDVILAKFDEHFVPKRNNSRAGTFSPKDPTARGDSRIVRMKSLQISRTL